MKLKIFAIGAIVSFSNLAITAEQTGYIVNYHLNSGATGRGACIQMIPSLPGSGWACLWKNNSLYTEVSSILQSVYLQNKKCKISGDYNTGNQHTIINWIECFN